MSVTKGATTLNTKGHLTHWGWVTHICISELATIGPDNGLSPSLRQAINWTNAGILSIGPLGINFNEILIEIDTFSFKKMRLKMSFAKWGPSCISLNVLNIQTSLIRIEIFIVELDHLMTVLNIYMRNSYTGKTVSIHWSRQHVSSFIILGCIFTSYHPTDIKFNPMKMCKIRQKNQSSFIWQTTMKWYWSHTGIVLQLLGLDALKSVSGI